MPKLICTKCERELRPHITGVNVVEYANFGPYKIWEADEWKCPECALTVIAGFSPMAFEHWQVAFEGKLRHIEDKPGKLRRDFENAAQREEFSATIRKPQSRGETC